MRASLFFAVGLCLAACSGNDISIGQNDSGNNPGSDSSAGQDGSNNGQDTGTSNDSGNQGNDSGGNPGKDGSVGLDAGCTGKVFQYQCGQNVCNGGDSQYCSPYPNMCTNTPQACQCNYNCMCLLAHAPPCIQGSLKCSVGSTGALYLSCF